MTTEGVSDRCKSAAAVSAFSIKATIGSLREPDRGPSTELLVDTGAAYSRLPRSMLVSLRIAPRSRRQFRLADGRTVEWEFGDALFVVDGYQAPSPVIFGDEGCPKLLGAVTLEAMGVGVAPVNRRLLPIDGLLASPY